MANKYYELTDEQWERVKAFIFTENGESPKITLSCATEYCELHKVGQVEKTLFLAFVYIVALFVFIKIV